VVLENLKNLSVSNKKVQTFYDFVNDDENKRKIVGIYSTFEFLLKGHFAYKIFKKPNIRSASYRTVTDCGRQVDQWRAGTS
jgi:hypothetical protein